MTTREKNMQHIYNEKRWIDLIIVFIILTFIGCSTTGGGVHIDWGDKTKKSEHSEAKTKKGGPPPHAPAHGYRAKYNYRYYPSSSVYFDAYRKVYFYLEGDNWRMSVSLPKEIHLKIGDYVSIEMDTDKPHKDFKRHKAKYPPGKKKKNKWSHNR